MSNPTGDDVSPPSTAGGREPGPFPKSPPIIASVPFGSAADGSPAPAPMVAPVEPEPEPSGERGRSVAAATLTALVVAAAGLGVGLLWLQLAPRVGIIKVDGGFVYAHPEPEEAIGADGVFGFLGVGAGVAVALLAWVLLRRYRGAAVLIGLVVGSLVGAWLAWWFAVRLGIAQFGAIRDTAPIGAQIDAPISLRITDLDRHAYWPPKVTGVVAAQALVAAVTYTMLAGFSIYPGLRPPRQRPQVPAGLSSAPAVPVDPTD